MYHVHNFCHWTSFPEIFSCHCEDFAFGTPSILYGFVTFEDSSFIGQVWAAYQGVYRWKNWLLYKASLLRWWFTWFCGAVGVLPSSKLHLCRHCLHLRNLNSDLDNLLIFRCKHNQHVRYRGHANMVCNPWLKTRDITLYTEGTTICVTIHWTTVDHMTLSPAKLNLIGTAVVNSRVMTWGNPKHKTRILPVYISCTILQLTLIIFHNKILHKWDLMFGF